MSKKPEHKIILDTPTGLVKLGTIMVDIYAIVREIEFVGLVPNDKEVEKRG